ncbi:MAG: hypothetical protein ABFE08_06220, partial [Armatimonadia bacterium]
MMRLCYRVCQLCLSLFLLAMVPLQAQDQKQLDGLKALFEKDPAAGFVEAERLFEKPKREGNLEGMLGIIEIVKDWSGTCYYIAPLSLMATAALPVATAKGNWSAVGDINFANAREAGGNSGQRGPFLAQRATEAYARAGKEPDSFAQFRTHLLSAAPELRRNETIQKENIAILPEQLRTRAEAVIEAVDRADDAEAVRLMLGLVEAASGESFQYRTRVAAFVGFRMWLPGVDALLPTLRQWTMSGEKEEPLLWSGMMNGLLNGCAMAWSGRPDAYQHTFLWGLERLSTSGAAFSYYGLTSMPAKCLRFRQPETADAMTRLLLDLPNEPQEGPHRWRFAVQLIHSHSPPGLRRVLVGKELEFLVWAAGNGMSQESFIGYSAIDKWTFLATAPEEQRATWYLETAYQILDYAPNFPTAASRSRAATEAAAYFTKAGRADLAAEATELAQSFAADDPKLRFQIALSSAQSAASAGTWEEVIKGLEPVVSGAPPSGAVVQGALLIRRAQLGLGKTDEAATWLGKAEEILGRAKVPAYERVAYLMNLAELTRDKAKKLALLKQADVAAAEAGLEPLREKVSQQLAELALAAGDLNTAETAFLDIIDRLESKREALAFDRILRQQWFADNLRPYQRLLRVEAMRKDPGMALWIAEKMRARALADQMAWQKVDLQVAVAPEVRERLKALREMRTKTYGLLQRAMGGERLTGIDVRGAYMPIRGAYLPIRGPLLGDQALSEADLKELRGLLDTLAKE